MNHNLHRASHVVGPFAVARDSALQRVFDPILQPAVGECMDDQRSMLVTPANGARVRVRLIKWKWSPAGWRRS